MSEELDRTGSAEAGADTGRAAPPAELLRRAISHVESLLERLEGPAGSAEAPAAPPVAAASATPLSQSQSAEAARVRQEAESEAAAIVRAAQAEANRIRSEAASEAASEVESALEEADRIREHAARSDDRGSAPA